MSAQLKVVEAEFGNLDSLPDGLRALADWIEKGEYGDAYNLAWVIDCGDGRIEAGLLGQSPSPGTVAYYLYGLAQRKLECI